MIIIEFFGPSGFGKSYFKNRLKNYFSFKILDYKSLYNLISDRNIFLKIFYRFIKLNQIQKIKNTYIINKIKKVFYGLIKIKKIKTNKSIKLNYELDKKKILIKRLIQDSNFNINNKKIFENWANEEVYVNHHAKKIKHQKILIDSEGLIQRLFIYCYRKKNKKQIIKRYLNTIELPQILIFFEKRKKNKENKLKIKKNEEKIIFTLTMSELRKKNVLIINSKIGINNSYLKIKKNLSYKKEIFK